MPGCAVTTCRNTNRNTKEKGIKYFSFPKNRDLVEQWIEACRRKDQINLKYARICSVHFNEDSYDIPLQQKLLNYCPKTSRNLKADAVPVLHIPLFRKPKFTEQSNNEPVLVEATETTLENSNEKKKEINKLNGIKS